MKSTIPQESPQESSHDRQHGGVPNHRSRVAHSKRVATRARIVSAILDLVADPANLTVSIEDVVKAAGIARGVRPRLCGAMRGGGPHERGGRGSGGRGLHMMGEKYLAVLRVQVQRP